MKRHSTSLVGKTQFKTTIKYHYIPARRAKQKKKKKGGGRIKRKRKYTQNAHSVLVGGYLFERNICKLYDLLIPLTHIYPTEMRAYMYQKICPGIHYPQLPKC